MLGSGLLPDPKVCDQRLFNMGVIADVILAVAEVAAALGAISEFQLGICGIRPAAHGAAVGIRRCAFLRATVEGDGTGLRTGRLFGRGMGYCFGRSFLIFPNAGNNIQTILAKKQQVIQNGDQREQIVGEVQAAVHKLCNTEHQVNHIEKC